MVVFFLIAASLASAQNPFCGFDVIIDQSMQEEGYQNQMEQNESDLQQMMKTGAVDLMDGVVFEVPVVVHVLHLGNDHATNISYEQIESAITQLTSDFRGQSGTGVDTEIEFCLAQRWPDGSSWPTSESGVTRTDITSICGSCTDGIVAGTEEEKMLKAAPGWFPNYEYLNIWVVNKITGANSNGEILGYAYFPNTTSDDIDGITIKYNNIGTIGTLNPLYNLNRVLTHEVGHFLDLYHTFQGDADGCPSIADDEGDMVADTDAHIHSSSDQCPTGDNDCYNPPRPLQDIVHNYMDYSSEICRTEFSQGQSDRMRGAMLMWRGGLISSLNCSPGDCIVDANFDYPATDVFTNTPITFNNISNGLATDTYEWFIDGHLVDDGDGDPHLTHTFMESKYTVICLQANGNDGSGGLCKNQICWNIPIFSDGLCSFTELPTCELLLNGDFAQYNQDLVPSYPEDYHFSNMESELIVICNWANTIGGSPNLHVLDDGSVSLRSDAMNIDPSPFVIPTLDAFTTQSELDLIHGSIYTLEFEYLSRIFNSEGMIEGINFAFSNNSLPAYSDLAELNQFSSTNNYPLINGQQYVISSNFEQQSYTFQYDANWGNYLTFFIQGNSALTYFKNISIKECNFCNADPIFEWEQTGCGSIEFTGIDEDPGAPNGTWSWRIESGPVLYDLETFTYNFFLEGDYEVCLDITCEDFSTQTYCETITVLDNYQGPGNQSPIACELCQNPETAVVNARRCDDTSNSFFVDNFDIQVPKGYGPCRENDFYAESSNGTIITNNYSIDESNSAFDIISMSFDFIADNPNNAMRGLISLCSADGLSSQCIAFTIDNPQTCESCNEITLGSASDAICDDSNPYDDVSEYSGTINLPISFFDDFCGLSSAWSGISFEEPYLNSNQTISIDYHIAVDSDSDLVGGINILACFDIASQDNCYSFTINVPAPCLKPLSCGALYTINASCAGSMNDESFFNINVNVANLPTQGSSFELCNDLIFEDGSSSSNTLSLVDAANGITNFYLRGDISLSLDCELIQGGTYTTDITVPLCDGMGNEDCITLRVLLTCDACPRIQDPKPRNLIYDIDERVSYYPNPASSYVTIDIDGFSPENEYLVELNDRLGRKVLTKKTNQNVSDIDISSIANGIHFIKILKNGKLLDAQKLVIIK